MSQRHPGSRRAPAASHADEPDDIFVAKVLTIGKWTKSNQQLLSVLGVIVVMAFAGIVYYRNYQEGLVQQAGQQLEAVHQSIAIADTEGAKAELVMFVERFAGTPYEAEARLLLGELYLQTGDAQQAQAVLGPIGASPRDAIEFQGATLLAAAYEQEKRWDEAVVVYLRIADRSELDFQVRDALVSAARIKGANGDVPGAIALFERAVDGLDENAVERGEFEMRIQELRTASGPGA